ncbi:hypothetical protein HHL19_24425 [Streptomyces sp. R302]|uniref:hypothetical protein n=1 Tax=unclassified Streptomyces TaxID=2593676 RepID=UPI00145CC4B7|nr:MULTISPECIES: hypothetical protein [unclassified Streptomyces]NML54449.1 hypothetical protein [Streptomyces sp. R301]NML81711.1 hypothetical protein [Streptomyces sp. R302]
MVLRRRAAALAAAAVLLLTPAVTACSDDEPATNNQVTSTYPPGMTAQPPGAEEPDDPAAAEAEITRNWVAFFDADTPAAERVKLLENGEEMEAVLAAFAGNPQAAATGAEVTDVAFTSASGADVTYDLLVGGNPALPDSRGTAVLQDDTWKVSVKTLCGLVKLSGVAVEGC